MKPHQFRDIQALPRRSKHILQPFPALCSQRLRAPFRFDVKSKRAYPYNCIIGRLAGIARGFHPRLCGGLQIMEQSDKYTVFYYILCISSYTLPVKSPHDIVFLISGIIHNGDKGRCDPLPLLAFKQGHALLGLLCRKHRCIGLKQRSHCLVGEHHIIFAAGNAVRADGGYRMLHGLFCNGIQIKILQTPFLAFKAVIHLSAL